MRGWQAENELDRCVSRWSTTTTWCCSVSPTCSSRTGTGCAVVEIDANEPVRDGVDIVLYDTFAQPESDHAEIAVLLDNPRARRVVVYTWNFQPSLVEAAAARASTATCRRRCPPASWSRHWRRCTPVNGGQRPRRAAGPQRARADWPGRGEGLTDRESEILALITQGKSNAEVAALTYLSPNTVKSYIRNIYRKIEVAQPNPGRALGSQQRLHPRSPSNRRLARPVALAQRADVRWHVDSVPPQVVEGDDVQRPLMGGGQHHRRGHPGLQRLPPAGGHHTPAVARRETGEHVFGHGGTQIVADGLLVVQEFGGHHRAHHVPADVLRSGGAPPVPVETGDRIDAAGFQIAAQNIEFAHVCASACRLASSPTRTRRRRLCR